ncbi:hypothetical protein LTR56_006036 [Elasticomyces elasticus]|nr:hypothetical protein LTR56_006036 [Elasticomyces elasticus]KAK3669002.1 hypothetical protein LTR22_000081 [Elasticomyces elasticus]KAK4922698.1 hypothetical protein LTR49_010054 [Elasticomyces elasticus]KAK5760953.1 hypothetical protein LTS12_008957 [Elasticomyces elasticus]
MSISDGIHAVAMLPGTTVSEHGSEPQCEGSEGKPHSFPGPVVDGRPSTVTLYEPSQLAKCSAIPALHDLINKAFGHGHAKLGFPNVDRLPNEKDYLDQVGTDAGTFVYIISWSDSGEPIATAGAHHYVEGVLVATDSGGDERSCFTRMRLPVQAEGEGQEVWELKLMAVAVECGGKGLASYLMKLADQEVKRRWLFAGSRTQGSGQKLWMVLTTIKEINEGFYERRGYAHDYETTHGPGHMGTPNGFHVVHMSKVLEG